MCDYVLMRGFKGQFKEHKNHLALRKFLTAPITHNRKFVFVCEMNKLLSFSLCLSHWECHQFVHIHRLHTVLSFILFFLFPGFGGSGGLCTGGALLPLSPI